jgi:hypothetical protein
MSKFGALCLLLTARRVSSAQETIAKHPLIVRTGGFPIGTEGNHPGCVWWLRDIFLMTQTILLAVMQGGIRHFQVPAYYALITRQVHGLDHHPLYLRLLQGLCRSCRVSNPAPFSNLPPRSDWRPRVRVLSSCVDAKLAKRSFRSRPDYTDSCRVHRGLATDPAVPVLSTRPPSCRLRHRPWPETATSSWC